MSVIVIWIMEYSEYSMWIDAYFHKCLKLQSLCQWKKSNVFAHFLINKSKGCVLICCNGYTLQTQTWVFYVHVDRFNSVVSARDYYNPALTARGRHAQIQHGSVTWKSLLYKTDYSFFCMLLTKIIIIIIFILLGQVVYLSPNS